MAGRSIHACFGHLDAMINSSEHCKEIFSNLKRLYLFTAPDNTPGQVTEEDVIRLADCFNKVTKVALIVHVAIESPEPRKGCATQAGVLHLSNGAKFIKTIVVDDPHVHHEDCQSCPTSQQE